MEITGRLDITFSLAGFDFISNPSNQISPDGSERPTKTIRGNNSPMITPKKSEIISSK